MGALVTTFYISCLNFIMVALYCNVRARSETPLPVKPPVAAPYTHTESPYTSACACPLLARARASPDAAPGPAPPPPKTRAQWTVPDERRNYLISFPEKTCTAMGHIIQGIVAIIAVPVWVAFGRLYTSCYLTSSPMNDELLARADRRALTPGSPRG